MIFYFFATLAILAACMVVISKNPVQSVLFLVLTFFSMAAVWMLLQSEFLAIVLVLVYVGAVMVLFLFVVMMLDVELADASYVKHWWLGVMVAALMLTLLIQQLLQQFNLPLAKRENDSHIKALGMLLYSHYLLAFEIAGVILLVAMIGAISLTFRGRSSKAQSANWQVQVTKKERLRLVKMGEQS